MIRRWLARRRWQRSQGPREAWVFLLDADGNQVGQRVPVVLKASDPLEFTAIRDVTFHDMPAATVTHVGVLGADGSHAVRPICNQ